MSQKCLKVFVLNNARLGKTRVNDDWKKKSCIWGSTLGRKRLKIFSGCQDRVKEPFVWLPKRLNCHVYVSNYAAKAYNSALFHKTVYKVTFFLPRHSYLFILWPMKANWVNSCTSRFTFDEELEKCRARLIEFPAGDWKNCLETLN